MKIVCANCGENREECFDLSYNYDLNGVVYCTCKNCKSKFVYQDGESSILGKYISDRSKFFSVLETAKLNGSYAGSPESERKKLVASYSSVAEVDPIYHWYKIEMITNNFPDYSKAPEAEREYLKISGSENYFVAQEDEARFGQYSRRYDAYKEEIHAGKAKKAKKRKRIITAVAVVLCLGALAGGGFKAYSCYSQSKQYTLSLDYGEAGGEIAEITAYKDKNIEGLPSEIEYGDKYYLEFTGWYTAENCGGIRVSGADGKSDLTLDKTLTDLSDDRCIKLYAGYRYKSYTVTFYSADGQSAVKTESAVYNTPLTEVAGEVVYGDWTVLSWSLTVGGEPYTGNILNDTKLYACGRGVNISFDSAGGSAVNMDMVKVGDKVVLPVPERQYYEFLGWSDGNNFIGGELIVPENKVNLVAQWKKTYFEVSFDTDGVAEIEPQILRAGSKVNLPNLTRRYYELAGWLCDGKLIDENFVLPEKDVTLVAKWVRTHYTVTFDTNGGTPAEDAVVRVGSPVTLPVTSRDYYRFEGWNYEDAPVGDTFVMPEKNVVLVAQWVKTHYAVRFDYGYLSKSETKYVLIGDSCAIPAVTREGYEFVGWFTSSGDEHKVNILPEDDTLLTARWKARKYSVLFNVNGGVIAGGTESATVTYGSSFKMPVPEKTTYETYTYKYGKNGSKTNKINYTVPHYFEGWYTSPTGGAKLTGHSGSSYSAWDIAENVTAYAHWSPLTVKYSSGTLNVKGNDHSRNLADIVNLQSVLKYTPAELRALGYTQITIDMFPNLREIDDGYQELLMSNSSRHEDVDLIWSNKKIEHTGGDKDTSSWTHYFTVTFDLSKLDNLLYFFVRAHGSNDDDWILNYLDIYFTVK